MHRSYIRIICFCIITFVSVTVARAQIGYDYSQFDIGVGASLNRGLTSIGPFKNSGAVIGNITYNQSPFINHLLEVQVGSLKGGDSLVVRYAPQYQNNYTAISYRMQIQLGEYLDYAHSPVVNAFKNLYGSAGLGLVFNRMHSINRYADAAGNQYVGKDASENLFIPLRIGYEFKIFDAYNQPDIKIDVGYQYNFVLGDDLDGYKIQNHTDAYSQFTLGIKFALGSYTSYKKQIYY